MSAYINYLNELTNINRSQYNEFINQIKWIGYYEAAECEEEKARIIQKLESKLNWSFKNTKPWINSLSKGCQLCAEGQWSCLFITGKCNANCFYCPTSQDTDGIPSTQLTSFDNPDDYVKYLEYFDFKGASLSGGEPLLVFDRTLYFVQAIKKALGNKVYLWIYTNGILGSESIFKQLATAGVDEVRFDIGATNYNLKYVQMASGIIPNITIEIPAVPEELGKLKQAIPELIKLGVTNLNLHQLRLTHYNAPKLLKRNYTYLHGEHATVLESELTALRIIDYVAENDLEIGVNYCAFNFKNRFQKAGFRQKVASRFSNENTELTEKGFLREINSQGKFYFMDDNRIIDTQQTVLASGSGTYEITYRGLTLDDHLENKKYLEKIIIGNKAFFLRSGLAQSKTVIDKNQLSKFIKLFETQGSVIPDDTTLFDLWKNEFIEWNLREYF